MGGLFICFLGRRLFKPVIFITGMVFGVAILWFIFYKTVLKDSEKDWTGWVVCIGVLVLGFVLGCLFIKIVKLGVFLLAAWGGFVLGLLLYNSFFYLYCGNGGLWGISLGIGFVCGIVALKFCDHLLIISTAMIGSFLLVSGVGVVAGGY